MKEMAKFERNSRKMQRPKRVIMKPPRYQTTSSDEAPPRHLNARQGKAADIEEDIDDLRAMIEQENEINQTERNTSPSILSPLHGQIRTYAKIPDSQPIKKSTITFQYMDSQSAGTSATQQPTQFPSTVTSSHIPTFDTSNSLQTLTPSTSSNAYLSHSVLDTCNAHHDFQGNVCEHHAQDSGVHQGQTYVRTATESEDIEVHDRLARLEAQIRRMNALLQKIAKCVCTTHEANRMTQKPSILPISSMEEMDNFQRIDNDTFLEVVNYMEYLGGYNLKEAINLCFKEAIIDSITPQFTWWGREKTQKALHNARITKAIYEAVSNNKYFKKPNRSEFQTHMREALRTAKERNRSRRNNNRRLQSGRDYWDDEETEENAEIIATNRHILHDI